MSNGIDPQFEQTWRNPTGFYGVLTEVNNQPIGLRFMVTSLVFFAIGGVMGLLIRIQLAVPENDFLGPQVYNQIFTMHGSTMMYLFAVPFLEGLALYLLPPMIGSRDVAFPRLTALGYWLYLFGGLIFYASFVVGVVPDAGWFAYTPLSGPGFSGLGVDFWLLGLAMVEIAGITAALEIVVSILKMRAPGMSLDRMPLFIWTMLVAGVMIVFAFTTLLTATLLLELDRAVGTHFFNPEAGGNSVLWQHLFWFFGHPEVYIIFLPATGVVSMVVGTFAGRLRGYVLLVVAVIVTGFLSFGLWVHHMYTTGLPELSMHFFAAASLMIAIASGVQVFAWIATLWGTRPAMRVPMVYVLGFLFIFIIGGMTGVMVAVVPFDWQVHDTFFIVAHFHYVLIGGAVFPIFAGLYYWLPKMTGRMLSGWMGHVSFWLIFIGFNVTFFPMHIMGFFGMPRRVYTYVAELNLGSYNMVATWGAFIMALGFVVVAVDFFSSLRRGRQAGSNPWGGDSLEWSIPSPPPSYTFLSPPIVTARHPLWREWQMPDGAAGARWQRVAEAMSGAPQRFRASLVSEAMTGEPQAVGPLPGPTIIPLWAALGVLLTAAAVLVKSWITAALGAAVLVYALGKWLRPSEQAIRMIRDDAVHARADLPALPTGTRSLAWWGALGFIVISATVFAVLFYAYFFTRLFSEQWPQGEVGLAPLLGWPTVTLTAAALAIGTQYATGRAQRANLLRLTRLWMAAGIVLAAAFSGGQAMLLLAQPFDWRANAYASLFFVITGAAMLMVLIAAVMQSGVLVRVVQLGDEGFDLLAGPVRLMAMIWYGAMVLALAALAVIHLAPRVIG